MVRCSYKCRVTNRSTVNQFHLLTLKFCLKIQRFHLVLLLTLIVEQCSNCQARSSQEAARSNFKIIFMFEIMIIIITILEIMIIITFMLEINRAQPFQPPSKSTVQPTISSANAASLNNCQNSKSMK